MDTERKLNLLATEARFERADPLDAGALQAVDPCASPNAICVHKARPTGIRLLKILQTNVCEYDCAYCCNRAQRDTPRASFSPDEMARLIDEAYRSQQAQGVLLSSGIAGSPITSMDRMLATAELLRTKYQYPGYIHLKILPGAERSQIEAAAKWANRLSVNLEAPSQTALGKLSSSKDIQSTLLRVKWIADALAARGRNSGQTTQFVVGPGGESDRDLLEMASRLYSQFGLRRAYYSAFRPVPQTPLEDFPQTPEWRELRLYQADFLMRLYRVRLSELPFDQNGNLIPDIDPKLAMAKAHPERFPVDVNRAEYEELLTVPGIGPISASRIVRRRAIRRIADERDLAFCGVVVSRAAPFILIDGRRVEAPPPPRKPKDNAKQLSLFDTAEVLCEKL